MIGADGTLCTKYGVTEMVLDVALSHATSPALIFHVRWNKPNLVAPDPTCSNVLLTQASATDGPFHQQSSVVSALTADLLHNVVQQVCFTCVPDMIMAIHGYGFCTVSHQTF